MQTVGVIRTDERGNGTFPALDSHGVSPEHQRFVPLDAPTDRLPAIPMQRAPHGVAAPRTPSRGRGPLVAVVAVLLVVVGVLGGILLMGGGDPGQRGAIEAAPAISAAPTTTTSASAVADRRVCVDFDARGGTLYTVFVMPMMAGEGGQKSVNIDIVQMQRATATLTQLSSTDLAAASTAIADDGERLVAAADALGLYSNTDGTALLTAFVGLAVECQKAGHKPSWFDAEELAST